MITKVEVDAGGTQTDGQTEKIAVSLYIKPLMYHLYHLSTVDKV